MRVRFARWLPVTFSVVAVVLLVVDFVLLLDEPGAFYPVLAAVVVAVLVAVMYVRLPCVVLTDTQIRVFNGVRLTTVPLRPRDRIVVDGSHLVVKKPGGDEHLEAYRLYANAEDWERLVEAGRRRGKT
ncbi:hypothetical protein [Cryptosporangium sp. NPDC051539]|uniref:hypothetical protein n=1 Tax=Cryptosporangium sp. NPDC051539 TaxID=3363962 RepID=UPI0037BD2D2E